MKSAFHDQMMAETQAIIKPSTRRGFTLHFMLARTLGYRRHLRWPLNGAEDEGVTYTSDIKLDTAAHQRPVALALGTAAGDEYRNRPSEDADGFTRNVYGISASEYHRRGITHRQRA